MFIGRDPESGVCIDDPTVSWHHAVIGADETGWWIEDLGSKNGTFVNGAQVQREALQDRDEIRIGSAQFLIVDQAEGEAERRAAVAAVEPRRLTRTMVITPTASPFLETALLSAAAALGQRSGKELGALVRMSLALPSAGSTAAAASAVMQAVFEALPEARAAVLLENEERGRLETANGWWRSEGACPGPEVEEEQLRRVMCNGEARLLEGSEAGNALLAAPLVSADGCRGVVAASSGGGLKLDQGHLEWLAAVAAIAAPALDSVRRLEWLEEENLRLMRETNLRQNMVGQSPAFEEVLRQVAKAAPADSTVLVRGETGTGKELVARAIHAGSRRNGRPFVAVNCATLSEHLLESDLFGHEKGAFTGAISQKRGKIEVAEGGSLFLDEVGELAPVLQAKLLRVMQEREFERVGGLRPIHADIRLIAATNRNLEEAVRAGTFRNDLYYRLNVITIHVPALRERREDIPVLASFFLARLLPKAPRRIAGFSPAARRRLAAYDWPGNVRELENAIERAAVLGSSELIVPEDLPESLLENGAVESDEVSRYHEMVSAEKKRVILAALEEAQGNQREAARHLGLNPTYLSRLIRNLHLKTSRAKAE